MSGPKNNLNDIRKRTQNLTAQASPSPLISNPSSQQKVCFINKDKIGAHFIAGFQV